VIGCDGSASAIRAEMLKLSRFNFSQQYLDYGYKELTIPAGPQGKHLLETHALHIWPRGNHMLIALPNIDGTFACILFLPFEGADSFASLTTGASRSIFRVALSGRGSVDATTGRQLLRQSDGRDGYRSNARRGMWKEERCFWAMRLMRSSHSSARD
jgi:hypothetical protein